MMKCYIKDYPRPQFVRKSWENLNGIWDFAFDDNNIGEQERWNLSFPANLTINVPFTYETKLSGIQDESRHDNIWYHRKIKIDKSMLVSHKYWLHFEGSDFITKIWVNGQFAGAHKGGYSRFSFDVSNLVIDGDNDLVVKVEDSFDKQQPRGKQRWLEKNYGCWYVQTTGIWKTVWAEYVPYISFSSIKMTPNIQNACVDIEYDISASISDLNESLEVEATVSFDGEFVNKNRSVISYNHVITRIDMFTQKAEDFHWSAKLWSPKTPHLYDIQFRLLKDGAVVDEIGSYFAMRDIRINGTNVLLNNRPLYQKLILDQGYWEDSHLTPPSEEALIEDIEKIQALGYTGLRKHQKTEDERFLYWCDVKGMLVWSEAPATYQYGDAAVEEFTREWMEIVKQNYNHPCIITWVPFNESWGVENIFTRQDQQHFTEAIYYLTKSIDPQRPVIVNDGWEHTISDIITLHDYEESGEKFLERYKRFYDEILTNQVFHCGDHPAFAEHYHYRGQPIIISEFGGIAFNSEAEGWGYGNKVENEEAFLVRFDSVTSAIKELPYVCGYCYTQVTDVQQEINGLLDSRRNFKVSPDAIREINQREIGALKRLD